MYVSSLMDHSVREGAVVGNNKFSIFIQSLQLQQMAKNKHH